MNSEGKFWVSIWSIAAMFIISIAFISSEYYSDKNAKIVDAIKSGVDPVDAVCALDNDGDYSEICTILAAKKQ